MTNAQSRHRLSNQKICCGKSFENLFCLAIIWSFWDFFYDSCSKPINVFRILRGIVCEVCVSITVLLVH